MIYFFLESMPKLSIKSVLSSSILGRSGLVRLMRHLGSALDLGTRLSCVTSSTLPSSLSSTVLICKVGRSLRTLNCEFFSGFNVFKNAVSFLPPGSSNSPHLNKIKQKSKKKKRRKVGLYLAYWEVVASNYAICLNV